MSIPNFKDPYDWEEFTGIFEQRLHLKMALLNRVRKEMFPNYEWQSLQPKMIEVLDDITRNLIYDTEYEFKDKHPEYKDSEDELFIPRRSFKEDVKEALMEANKDFWNGGEAPLHCQEHFSPE